MAIQIRHAVISDAVSGALLHIETWQSAYRGLMPDEYLTSLKVEEFEQNWKKAIENTGNEKLRVVAEEAGRLVGFVGAGPTRWPVVGYSEELYGIYVHPSQQGKGIGRQMLLYYQNWLRGRNKDAFTLWVLKDNHPTRRFYEATGGMNLGLEKADRSFGDVLLTEIAYGWKNF